jgi:hypothetical protein
MFRFDEVVEELYQVPFLNDPNDDIGIGLSHVENLRSVALLLIIISLI